MIQTRAIVLKRYKFREADLIVHFLSVTGAKFNVIARGALRSKKRFSGGVLEPTHHVEIRLEEPKQEQQLYVLTEATLIDGFPELRKDYDKLNLALKIVEAAHTIAQEGDQLSSNLFNLIGHSLKTLQSVEQLDLFELHFFIKILYQQGVLEQEEWMGDLIGTPIHAHLNLSAENKSHTVHLPDVDRQFNMYLQTAQIHSKKL